MQCFILLASILLGACGQITLKIAADRLVGISFSSDKAFASIVQVFSEPVALLGILFFVSSMFLWLQAIQHMELSRAYPTVALSYLIVFVASVFLFKEAVTASKIAGLAMVLGGIILLHI